MGGGMSLADDNAPRCHDLEQKNLALEARIAEIKRLIANDAYAMTFQSLGQYRSALLKALHYA